MYRGIQVIHQVKCCPNSVHFQHHTRYGLDKYDLSCQKVDYNGAMTRPDFDSFGDLLKYLRRRARLTQKELSIATGYSESYISRLEKNQRPPDTAAISALFVPALDLENDPETAVRLLELAQKTRGTQPPTAVPPPASPANRPPTTCLTPSRPSSAVPTKLPPSPRTCLKPG